VWLLGATFAAANLLRHWVRVRRVKSMLPRVTDERVLRQVAQHGRLFSLNRPPDVLVAPDNVGPCLIGILRPVIVLPASLVKACSDQPFSAALTHELAHVRRRDLVWNWLPALADVAFFFHPLVWLARRELCLVQEIATDQLAVSVSDLNVADYARLLVELAAHHPTVTSSNLAVAVTESYCQLSRRIVAMKRFRKLTTRHRLFLLTAVLAMAALGVVPWRLTAQDSEQKPIVRITAALPETPEIIVATGGIGGIPHDSTHWNADPADHIFKIGTFKKADERGRPVGWTDLSAFDSGYADLDTERRGTLTLTAPMSKSEVAIRTTLDLPRGAEHVTFMVRLRGPTIKRDDKPGAGGGVLFSLIDSEGKSRDVVRIDPSYSGYRNWLTQLYTARIRPDDRRLRISVILKDAEGRLDVHEIFVVPSTAEGEATVEQSRALAAAIHSDDADAVARLIEQDPRLLEMRTGDDDNGTPLIRAAWSNSTNVVSKLIELGADIEARDYNWRNTALRWCCWWGDDQVGEILLRAGAQTRGASQLAQNAKKGNPWPRHEKEAFDRLSQLIDQYEAKRANE